MYWHCSVNSSRVVGSAVGLAFALASIPASHAATPPRRAVLPAIAAAKAVLAAVQACRTKGYNVTATVVNPDGMIEAVLRGDQATPHTIENSFNKAYTAVSLGPIQKVDSTAKIYDAMKLNPGFGTWPLPPAPIRGFTFNPGGLAIMVNGEYLAAIGVSGAPKGTIDEECAQAGRSVALAAMP